MRKDVGKLGEKAFGLICQQAGLLVHQPDQDLLGWDFFVEDPCDASQLPESLDKAPPPLEFRVQVKSTDGPTRRVSISLAQMLRLATLQMPVFFCVLAFNGQQLPVRAFLIHLGEEIIARTLARVRRLGADRNKELHKYTLSIAYDASHEMAAPFPEAIRSHIARHVPAGMTAYIGWKNNLVASAGYADPRIVSDLTFEGVKTSDFVDFFLGLKDELSVQHIHTVEHRFGIPRQIEPSKTGPAKLSITEHPRRTDAIISFRKDHFSPAFEFSAAWYCPPSALNLPEDQFRLRFVAPTFEVVLWPYVNKIEFKDIAPAETEYPIKELAEFAAAMNLMSDPKTPPCLINVSLGGKAAFNGTIKMKSTTSNWAEYSDVAAAAQRLATMAGVVTHTQTSLIQLLRHKATLLNIHKLVDGAPTRVTFEHPDYYHPNDHTGFLRVFCVRIGNFRVAGVFAVIGKSVAVKESYRLDSRSARFIRVFARPMTEEWSEDIEAELLRVASDALIAENIIPVAA